MKSKNTEEIEINLLIEALRQKYGYDFSEYSLPSFLRRIDNFLAKTKYKSVSDIIPDILRDGELFIKFLNYISVTVTEMFRDPSIYLEIRKNVIPLLRSFPRINVWHGGCATGEEVYSFAILLKEEGLYERTNIYATDFDPLSLEKAREGIFPIEVIKQGTENYKKSGGKHPFTDYYRAAFEKVILDNSLKYFGGGILYGKKNLKHH